MGFQDGGRSGGRVQHGLLKSWGVGGLWARCLGYKEEGHHFDNGWWLRGAGGRGLCEHRGPGPWVLREGFLEEVISKLDKGGGEVRHVPAEGTPCTNVERKEGNSGPRNVAGCCLGLRVGGEAW